MKGPTNQRFPLAIALFPWLLTLLIVIFVSAYTMGQSSLVSEDFESGSGSWTFVTNSGGNDNYWEVSNGSCSNGSNQLMIRRNTGDCIYRRNRANNVTAYIAIDATGYENLTLDFDWICNGQAGNDYGSVYYSTDASNWTQITDGGNSGIYQGTTSWSSETGIPLPTSLNNTSFYLGFNWVNNASGGSYPAFGVDNIDVQGDLMVVQPPQAPVDAIFSEDFSSGGLPSGWTRTNSNGTWSFNNPGGRTINTTTAANGFAIFDSDNIGQDNQPEVSDLITPAIDCSDYAIVTLSLEHYFRYYNLSDYRISVSGDNGNNYTTLIFDSTETANAETLNFDISAEAAGQSQVRLKFTYRGNWSWYWAVDDIIVEGQQADSATWTGAVSTAWNTAGNWSTNQVPNTATALLIPAATPRMPVIGASTGAAGFNLTIESGATLTLAADSAQGGNLTLTGDLRCEGSIVKTGNAPIRLTGAGRVISGNYSGGSNNMIWQLETGAHYLLDGDFTTYNVRVLDGAMLDLNGHDLSIYKLNQYGTLELRDGNLSIGGPSSLNADNFSAGTGLVLYNAGSATWSAHPIVAQTISSVNYYHLQVRATNGYNPTLGTTGTIHVAGNLTLINPGISAAQINTSSDIMLEGDLVLGSVGTGDITLNLSNRIIGAGASSAIVQNGSTSNQIVVSYTNNSLPAIDNFGNTLSNFTYPVSYTGNGTQMIVPATYSSLTIGGTGSKALGDDITVTGNLNINSGTLTTAVSMVTEKVSLNDDVAVNYRNNGIATNNTVPSLANLNAFASSMQVTVPAMMDGYAVAGLYVTIPHTYNADLDIYLASPGGTVYVVSTDNGGNGGGYDNVRFSDAGSGTFPNNTILNGHYRPEGFNFSNITGSIAGTWTLYVIDDADQDVGTLTDFSLQLQSRNTYGDITLAGNWTNNGGSFTAGTGIVTFNGGSQQQVTTNGSNFYQVQVNNTGGLLLQDNLTVTDALTLTSGVVTTGSNRLIMTNADATKLVSHSSSAFVNGNLRRYIASNSQIYAFPVGNGTGAGNYRLAEIQNSLLVGVSYIDAHFQSLSNHNDADLNVTDDGMAITRLHSAGTWVIEPNAQPIVGVYGIRLSLNGFSGLTDNEFVVLKRPANSTSGSDWSTGGGLLNIVNGLGRLLSDGFAMRTGLSSFSEFGIGDGSGGAGVLPIELLSFTARPVGESVKLDWATAVEIENDFFTIERSGDGVVFDSIARVNGAGNSSMEQQYQMYDNEPLIGTSYYRLKQTDYDGTYTYSAIQAVTINDKMAEVTVQVYPNPSAGNFLIKTTGTGSAEIYITDMQGRTTYTGLLELGQSSTYNLREQLSTGMYQLSIVLPDKTLSQRIIIQ